MSIKPLVAAAATACALAATTAAAAGEVRVIYAAPPPGMVETRLDPSDVRGPIYVVNQGPYYEGPWAAPVRIVPTFVDGGAPRRYPYVDPSLEWSPYGVRHLRYGPYGYRPMGAHGYRPYGSYRAKAGPALIPVAAGARVVRVR